MTWYLEEGQICAVEEDFLLVLPSIVTFCFPLNDILHVGVGMHMPTAPYESFGPPRFSSPPQT